MDLKLLIIYLSLVIMMISCNNYQKYDINKDEFSNGYVIDNELYIINKEKYSNELLEVSQELPKFELNNRKKITLDNIKLKEYKKGEFVSGYFYKNNLFLYVVGYREVNLNTGEKIYPYKSISICNVETSEKLEVSNKWIDGVSKNFFIYDKYIVIQEITDPNYDVVGVDIENSKSYKYAVVDINNFNLIKESEAKIIVKQLIENSY